MEQLVWLREFILDYPSLQFLSVFIGAALGGEIALVTLSFLSAQNIISIPALVIFSALGAFASDSLWFFVGKTSGIRKVVNHKYATPAMDAIAQALKKVSRGNNLAMLIFAKFLIGTRVVTLFFISSVYDNNYRQFAKQNIIAILVWLSVVIPVGYLSGLGFTYIAEVMQNIYAGIGFIFLVILVIITLQIWLKRTLIQTQDQ